MENLLSSITTKNLLDNLEEGESITFYVLPNVKEKEDPELKITYKDEILVSYIKNGEVHFANVEGTELGEKSGLRMGQKITMYDKYNGERDRKRVPEWESGGRYGKEIYCFGQTILISAPPGGGKTTALAGLCKSFEAGDTGLINKVFDFSMATRKVLSYRIKFGEREDDTMYLPSEIDLTIDADSTAPIEVQLSKLYEVITLALRDAYMGNHVILAIDSLTRLIENLTGLYAHTHMVAGGISFDVTTMVDNLIRMGGQYGDGTLTLVGTCLTSPSSNTWKNIYTRLSAAANGEIKVARSAFSRKKGLSSTMTRREEVKVYPFVTLFGKKFHY